MKKKGKLQTSVEFISTYGFAILIIAIVLGAIYVFVLAPQKSPPSSCTFSPGTYCNDILITSNSQGLHAIILLTNSQQYPIVNPSVAINTSQYNAKGLCSPNYVAPGGAIFCNVTLTTQNSLQAGTLLVGSVSLIGTSCPGKIASSCASSPKQTYTGSFTTHTELASTSLPQIVISVENSTQYANGVPDKITASINYYGYALTGATINFTIESETSGLNAQLVPGIATTSSNGTALSYISSTNMGTANVVASFGSYNAMLTVTFTAPPSSYTVTSISSTQTTVCVNGCTTTTSTTSSSTTTVLSSQYLGYLYAIGFSNANAFYAPITSNGIIGPWTATNGMSVLSYNTGTEYLQVDGQCTQGGNYVYCPVATVSGSAQNVYQYIYSAQLTPQGIGSWSLAGTYPLSGVSLAAGNEDVYSDGTTYGNQEAYFSNPSQPNCVASSSYIYCVGGIVGYNANYPSGSDCASELAGQPGALQNNLVFSPCGSFAGHETNAVYYASITNGVIGTWQLTTSYPINIAGGSCNIAGNYIYCYGGFTNSNGYGTQNNGVYDGYSPLTVYRDLATAASYYAPISSSGVGSWTAATSLPNAVNQTQCLNQTSYVYCLSVVAPFESTGGQLGYYGYHYQSASSTNVASIPPSGSWTQSGSSQQFESCAGWLGYIYCYGKPSYSQVSSTSVGTWQSTPTAPGGAPNGYSFVIDLPPGSQPTLSTSTTSTSISSTSTTSQRTVSTTCQRSGQCGM